MVIYQGDVAQLVERGLCKPEVVGSNPIVSTALSKRQQYNLNHMLVTRCSSAAEHLLIEGEITR